MAKHRRRIFLINKKFQLRFALYVCAWLVAASFVYPVLLNNVANFFISIVAAKVPNADIAGLNSIRDQLFLLLIGSESALLALTFLVTLFIGHRIAGPIYKLGLYLDRVRQGDLTTPLHFRKFDHFKEVSDQYNEMLKNLRERVSEASTHIQRAMEHVDGDGRAALQAALKALPKTEAQVSKPVAEPVTET